MFIPLNHRLTVRRDPNETVSPGGIIIPGKPKETPITGEVVAVGSRVEEIFPGQKIIFGKYAGNEVKIDGEDLLIINDTDVLAIIQKESL
jgi:chaperonin GroES